jgi:hypothetical protein
MYLHCNRKFVAGSFKRVIAPFIIMYIRIEVHTLVDKVFASQPNLQWVDFFSKMILSFICIRYPYHSCNYT